MMAKPPTMPIVATKSATVLPYQRNTQLQTPISPPIAAHTEIDQIHATTNPCPAGRNQASPRRSNHCHFAVASKEGNQQGQSENLIQPNNIIQPFVSNLTNKNTANQALILG